MEVTIISALTPESCETIMANEELDPRKVVYFPPEREERINIISAIIASSFKVVRYIGVFSIEELKTLGVI